MIPSILSSFSSSNTGSSRLSVSDNSGERRSSSFSSLESSLSSSPSISHPLLRNQWATRTSTSSIVSPAASPLMTRYPSRQSSSEIMISDDHNSNEREVFSIFSSLDWTEHGRINQQWFWIPIWFQKIQLDDIALHPEEKALATIARDVFLYNYYSYVTYFLILHFWIPNFFMVYNHWIVAVVVYFCS